MTVLLACSQPLPMKSDCRCLRESKIPTPIPKLCVPGIQATGTSSTKHRLKSANGTAAPHRRDDKPLPRAERLRKRRRRGGIPINNRANLSSGADRLSLQALDTSRPLRLVPERRAHLETTSTPAQESEPGHRRHCWFLC